MCSELLGSILNGANIFAVLWVFFTSLACKLLSMLKSYFHFLLNRKKEKKVKKAPCSTEVEGRLLIIRELMPSTLPVIRSKSQGSGGVAPGLSEATAKTSGLAGPRPLGPILRHHFPSPLPAHTCDQGPAPVRRQRPRSQRPPSHPSAL